jgi:alpha-N-arabinofuranosidase
VRSAVPAATSSPGSDGRTASARVTNGPPASTSRGTQRNRIRSACTSLQTGWTRWCNERFEKVDKIHGVDNWPVTPHLAEDAYTVADAVVVGNLLISLPKRADRVTSASLAQLVHVIAPIMTEPGGIAWRQTTFFPFASTSAHATGAVVTMRLEFDLDTLGEVTAASAQTLADGDAYATNTLTEPERVVMRTNVSLTMSGRSCSLELPRVLWTVITVCCAPPHP